MNLPTRNWADLRHRFQRLKNYRAGRRLEQIRIEEKARFRELAPRFSTVLQALIKSDPSTSDDPEWARFNLDVADRLMPAPPFGFLRRAPLSPTIYWDSVDPLIAAELAELERRFTSAGWPLHEFLIENAAGRPYIYEPRHMTSSILVHHLLEILLFSEMSPLPLHGLHCVVEWGGGYGGLARLLYRFQPDLTYILLDTPVMLAVQWLYLSTVLGPDRVILPTSSASSASPGSVQLAFSANFKAIGSRPDVFVSTFALSESPRHVIARVIESQWFGAEHLWLAYTPANVRFPQWRDLETAAIRAGGRVVQHPYHSIDRLAAS